MRSLPICRAFLNPFASNCKGSSTLGFVRRVTESDWRRPRKVGVRQELVRVSVRAVDMLSFFFGFRWFPAIGVRDRRPLARPGPRRRRLRIGGRAQHRSQPSAQLAERVQRLAFLRQLAVDRAGRLCFAWASRRLASIAERFGQLLVCLGVDRGAWLRIVVISQLPQSSPSTTAVFFHQKPATLNSASAWRCSLGTLSRHRRP